MKHARPDYNRFQDPEGKIPEDEPVLIIRGQDVTSPAVAEFWADEAERHGASDEIVQLVRDWANVIRTWQKEHGFKIPDLPHENRKDNT